MLQLFPENAEERLEFDKIKHLIIAECATDAAVKRVERMAFFSKKDQIEKALDQTAEFKQIMQGSGAWFPIDQTENLEKTLKHLSIQGGSLSGKELAALATLALNIQAILQWFKGKEQVFPELFALSATTAFEPMIPAMIFKVVDERGQILDNASPELGAIRSKIARHRQELRNTFDRIVRKLNKQGYLADIRESFLNGRRSLAVFAEHKRIVKGIIHGSSDTQRTVFIEPEETIELNNALYELEREEQKEIKRILLATTAELCPFQQILQTYYRLIGIYDFIRAKAKLAVSLRAERPVISAHPGLALKKAFHPLLLRQHQQSGKQTVPLNVALSNGQNILMISGPNAGGKTVTMKTVGLLQLMVQAGLLIPADPRSEVGVFKQLMMHIGDWQSIENELSTYSAHLKDMKHFLEFANGKTLFFIDELGSGSDPALGGAFAEAIVERLAEKRAYGIITTHYLNLKAMAGKVSGVENGAMAFDEEQLEPLYQLITGKPGSSYTFAIAQRIGLHPQVIGRARHLAERGHIKLDKVLYEAEQQSRRLKQKEEELDKALVRQEQARKRYEVLADKESRRQQVENMKLQNTIRQEELVYLKETERKFKQILQEWKRAENKQEVLASAEEILFRRKQIRQNESAAKKADRGFKVTGGAPEVGDLVRHTINHQVGRLLSKSAKNATVQIGKLPFTVNLQEWVRVVAREPLKNVDRRKGKQPPVPPTGEGGVKS